MHRPTNQPTGLECRSIQPRYKWNSLLAKGKIFPVRRRKYQGLRDIKIKPTGKNIKYKLRRIGRPACYTNEQSHSATGRGCVPLLGNHLLNCSPFPAEHECLQGWRVNPWQSVQWQPLSGQGKTEQEQNWAVTYISLYTNEMNSFGL